MKKAFPALTAVLLFAAINPLEASRDSVSSAEVNGTFLMHFSGKFKDFSNKLTVKAKGGGKLNIDFDLAYPYEVNNETMANTGQLSGEASISGDTAIYENDEYGQCKITIVFTKPGEVNVTQEGTDADCGFGHNVYANGTYHKS